MMKEILKNVIGVMVIGMLLFSGCKKDPVEPVPVPGEKPYLTTPYPLVNPDGFPEMHIDEENPITLEGVALGRMLYYDPIMDKDSSRTCASCHHQDQSFQIDNGTHQVVPHLNLGWKDRFMWNGGFVGTLEDVMTFEVESFFETDLRRLNNNANYRKLFKEAFDADVITSKEAAFALAQFARILTSANSKFDQYLRGEAVLSTQEMEGLVLFNTEKADCFHCHGTALFTDNTPRNNGLDQFPEDGLMSSTGDPKDVGKFKTPTLRNIEYTAPYMHDGRFATLEDVIEFYSTGVHTGETVDPLMKNAHAGGLHMTTDEKAALLAFLKILSDPDYLTNSELSSPF